MAIASVVSSLGRIILIDLSLSGDNAAVIGLAVRDLPPKQGRLAAILGASGAIATRMLFAVLATLLLRLPYLNAIGGVILAWITWKLAAGTGTENHKSLGGSFWSAVWTIILADVSTGFDNVMAVAGAAHGSAILVVIGLAISMPILIWGSTWVARLMQSYPFVIFLGAAVLAHTSLAMIVEDEGLGLAPHLGIGAVVLPWAAAAAVAVWGWIWCQRTQTTRTEAR